MLRCVRRTVMLIVVAACALVAPATAQERDKVLFALNWLPVGESAGWYLALEKGYFRDERIDVEIVRGFGSGDTAKRVAAKRATFGVVDIGTMILLRINEGIKVRSVAMFYSRAPHAVFFRSSSSIKTPKDLEGKSIACPATSANKVMFPVFASLAGFDANKVQWRITDSAVAIPTFVAGRADAMCEFLIARPNIASQSREKISQFVFADYGFDIYSNSLVAEESTVTENPDLVRRFVRAAMRGVADAIKNPDEAIQALMKHAPENKQDIALQEWKLAASLVVTDETKANGLGFMDPKRVGRTYDVVTSAFGLDKSKDQVDNLYTNRFLK